MINQVLLNRICIRIRTNYSVPDPAKRFGSGSTTLLLPISPYLLLFIWLFILKLIRIICSGYPFFSLLVSFTTEFCSSSFQVIFLAESKRWFQVHNLQQKSYPSLGDTNSRFGIRINWIITIDIAEQKHSFMEHILHLSSKTSISPPLFSRVVDPLYIRIQLVVGSGYASKTRIRKECKQFDLHIDKSILKNLQLFFFVHEMEIRICI